MRYILLCDSFLFYALANTHTHTHTRICILEETRRRRESVVTRARTFLMPRSTLCGSDGGPGDPRGRVQEENAKREIKQNVFPNPSAVSHRTAAHLPVRILCMAYMYLLTILYIYIYMEKRKADREKTAAAAVSAENIRYTYNYIILYYYYIIMFCCAACTSRV